MNVVVVNKKVAEMDMAGFGTALYLYSEIYIESQGNVDWKNVMTSSS